MFVSILLTVVAGVGAFHSADYNPQNGRIELTELLRVIQFYNSGGYYSCESGEDGDGFCAGSPPGEGEPEGEDEGEDEGEGEGGGDDWVEEEETDGDFFIGEFATYHLTLPGPGTIRVQAYDGSFLEATITATSLSVTNRVTATIAVDILSDGRLRVTKDWVSGTELEADWIRFGFKEEDETSFNLVERTVTVR